MNMFDFDFDVLTFLISMSWIQMNSFLFAMFSPGTGTWWRGAPTGLSRSSRVQGQVMMRPQVTLRNKQNWCPTALTGHRYVETVLPWGRAVLELFLLDQPPWYRHLQSSLVTTMTKYRRQRSSARARLGWYGRLFEYRSDVTGSCFPTGIAYSIRCTHDPSYSAKIRALGRCWVDAVRYGEPRSMHTGCKPPGPQKQTVTGKLACARVCAHVHNSECAQRFVSKLWGICITTHIRLYKVFVLREEHLGLFLTAIYISASIRQVPNYHQEATTNE